MKKYTLFMKIFKALAGRGLPGMVLSTIPGKTQRFLPFSVNSVNSV
jgi:hypothetical protein